MSKVPYIFSAVPNFLFQLPWFLKEKHHKFFTWLFNKCSMISKTIWEYGQKIILEPMEFVATYAKHCHECFLSEGVFKGLMKLMTKMGIIEKSPKSIRNKLSIYRVNVSKLNELDPYKKSKIEPTNFSHFNTSTSSFLSAIVQVSSSQESGLQISENDKQTELTDCLPTVSQETDKNLPTDYRQISRPIYIHKRSKESLQTGPTDFSSKKIEVIAGVTMTQKDYEECLKIKKGSKEAVQEAILYILSKKSYEIKNWPNALRKWDVKPTMNKADEHEEIAKNVVKKWENHPFCVVEFYRDRNKDQKGLLFCKKGCTNYPPIFVPFSDGDFKQKVVNIIRKWKELDSEAEIL